MSLPPKFNKTRVVHKWVNSFVLHLSQKVGVRNAPLDYVVRENTRVDLIPPAREPGNPNSSETGSIDGDLTARMLHNHPLYKVDNRTTFDMIKLSVRGHDVAVTITPFHRAWDGRRALLALQFQHAGKAVYDQLVKDSENILKNRTWNSTSAITLIQHMGLNLEGVYYPLRMC